MLSKKHYTENENIKKIIKQGHNRIIIQNLGIF